MGSLLPKIKINKYDFYLVKHINYKQITWKYREKALKVRFKNWLWWPHEDYDGVEGKTKYRTIVFYNIYLSTMCSFKYTKYWDIHWAYLVGNGSPIYHNIAKDLPESKKYETYLWFTHIWDLTVVSSTMGMLTLCSL